MNTRLVLSVVAAATLAACGTAPTVQPAKAPVLPATFAQAPAGAATTEPAAAFWRGFNDAELDALVAEALKANADVRIAVARVQEARAAVRVADAGDLPTVGATAQAGRARADRDLRHRGRQQRRRGPAGELGVRPLPPRPRREGRRTRRPGRQ